MKALKCMKRLVTRVVQQNAVITTLHWHLIDKAVNKSFLCHVVLRCAEVASRLSYLNVKFSLENQGFVFWHS